MKARPKTKAILERHQIDPEKFYSARELCRSRLLPWASAITFASRLRTDEYVRSILKPSIFKRGMYLSYRIKGENVIEFLDLQDKGELTSI